MLKVGDKVRVNEGQRMNINFVPSMRQYQGGEYKIRSITKNVKVYTLEGANAGGNYWNFHGDDLTLVSHPTYISTKDLFKLVKSELPTYDPDVCYDPYDPDPYAEMEEVSGGEWINVEALEHLIRRLDNV